MDAMSAGHQVNVRIFFAAACDNGIEIAIRDPAGEPLLPEVADSQFRIVCMFTSNLQERHQILGSVVGSQSLIHQSRQEQFLLTQFINDSCFRHGFAA
jgi:hypothetical protein